MISDASRELGVYSQRYWVMYTAFAVALVFLAAGMGKRWKVWRSGKGRLGTRAQKSLSRLGRTIADILSHRQILRRPVPGLSHLLVWWGGLLFFTGTVSLMLQEVLGLSTFSGTWYLFLSLGMDVMTVLATVGILILAGRRYIIGPESLPSQPGDALILGLMLGILLSGTGLEALRMAASPDPYERYAPVGAAAASLLAGWNPGSLWQIHGGLWWIHMFLAMGLIAVIPYTKLIHILTGPASLFLTDRRSGITLPLVDFEDKAAREYGATMASSLHWKSLLDLDACMQCGRCQDVCPAHIAGKPLSPMAVGVELRKYLERSEAWQAEPGEGTLVDGAIHEDALWACTSCRACDDQCPVGVEHLWRLVEMRRGQVMMKARFPGELQTVFRGLETNGNPWNRGRGSREDRARRAGLPLAATSLVTEYLLWQGCAGAFDRRVWPVIESLSAILTKAGITFSVMGNLESCCGDPARRLGNEYLFQRLAQENLEAFSRLEVKKVITICPHCLNTLGNEYGQLGGDLEVIHHSQLISELMASGLYTPPVGGWAGENTITYHDPCYLARYNGITSEPRQVVKFATDIDPNELPDHMSGGLCCGGGGGRVWMDEAPGTGINRLRVEQIKKRGASLVATACPYCLIMLSDGVADSDINVEVMDIAQIAAGQDRIKDNGRRVA